MTASLQWVSDITNALRNKCICVFVGNLRDFIVEEVEVGEIFHRLGGLSGND